MIEPLNLSYDIKCSAEHAWDVWTTKFSMWWPKGHTTSGDPDTVVAIEAGVGGRIFETTSAGDVIEWGRVTEWSPPSRLAYTWHIGHAAENATLVVIDFVAVDDESMRIEIEQTGWENMGDRALAYREGNTAGWGGLIPRFTEAAEA